MSDINEKATPPAPSGVKAASVNYDNLGEVFTKVSAWDGYDPQYIKPDQLNIDIESTVYSVVDGVSGWALKTILGYELNGEIVQDDTGNPEVINYADEICKRHKAWTITKTHEPQTIRCFVKSVGQNTGGQPNVAAYPLGNEVSVNLTIPAREKYTITFNANGGENAPAAQTKWHNETLILSSQKPTRTDYVFMGWSKTKKEPSSGNYAIDCAAGASFTENTNTTLYAVWKPRPLVIKYDANGGTGAPADQSKEYGKSVNITTAKPKKINSEFLGWSTTASGEVQYTGGSIYNTNANLSLFAIWRRIPIMKSLNGYEVYDEAVRELALGVTTTGTGAAYKADVKAIDVLTVGVNFTIVPHVTCTTLSPTLDVNGFGAKPIKQRLSSGLTNTIALASNDMFAKGKPVNVFYDGTSWVIDVQALDATHLNGVVPVGSLPTVPVNKGGTGATTAFAALNNLGITWGTEEAPANGTPNSIYIQIN